ncbi:type I-E CRISPR-associated protein Cse2/CasB [Actinokineospora inagensis]|uniref:type I-E CRISPR-associated protein Cse2/CasB n=1 Tax=Actinokineospora inagensis TaxID=103730 RepID=UPI0004241873|nr:type I-E CRISPR-associated protein Cse2/CasB [Actinokineospora inagensis]
MTTSQSASAPKAEKPLGIAAIVAKRVSQLQRGYLDDRAESVAALAKLRRGVGKPTGSVLDILDYTTHEEFIREWNRDEPSKAEHAAHTAMTLYAVHQQSQRTGMHYPEWTLGRSIRELIPKDAILKADNAIVRRFARLGTADSYAELSHHLRGMVQLLRAERVRLDYGRLALDLLLWQLDDRAPQVRQRWGRDFYFPRRVAASTPDEPNTTS